MGGKVCSGGRFSIDTSCTISGVRFKNPVIAASGTFGFGDEYSNFFDVTALGGICTKALTLRPRSGNKGARIYETPSGLLNSIGLENPGIEKFVQTKLEILRKLRAGAVVVIVNLAGETVGDYVEGMKQLCGSAAAPLIDMIELNISCPNVENGGLSFGLDAKCAVPLLRQARKACTKPLIVKLSPAARDITELARAAEGEGADAVSLVNTFKAMAIDVKRRRCVFERESAGLSGPAIYPIALRIVWELVPQIKIPVIGIGGIHSPDSALQFLLAGARAIEVGSATFSNPLTMLEIISGIKSYMIENKIKTTSALPIRASNNK